MKIAELEREQKNNIWRYYASNQCVCGRNKLSMRWLCRRCWKIAVEVGDWKKISEVCDKHLQTVASHLEGVDPAGLERIINGETCSTVL